MNIMGSKRIYLINTRELHMARMLILWLLGVPIVAIILLKILGII